MPIETVLVRYYNNHAKNIRSAQEARRSLDKWSTFFAEQPVSSITTDTIDEFMASLRAQGHSEGYIGRILRSRQGRIESRLQARRNSQRALFETWFNWCRERAYIDTTGGRRFI